MQSYVPVVLPIFGGAIAISIQQIAQRWALKGRASPMPFLAVGFVSVVALLCLTYVAAWGLTMPAHLLPGFWSAVLAGTAANYGIQYVSGKAATYKQGEVSLTAPIGAMTPGLIMLLAVTLGEFPGTAGKAGITLMVVGSWILLSPPNVEYWWEYLGPLYRLSLVLRWDSLSQVEKERAIVVWLALSGAMMGTIGLLCDGLYTRRGVDMQGLWLALIVLIALLALGYCMQAAHWMRRNWALSTELLDRRFMLGLAIFAATWMVHLWLIQPVFNETLVAYVGTLKRLSVLVSVVLGYLIFREGEFKKRLWAAVLIVVGAVLIGSENLPEHLATKLDLLGL